MEALMGAGDGASDKLGNRLEAIAMEWIAEAAALQEGCGVHCWPVGSATGAGVLIVEREAGRDSRSFSVTLCGGEGVEYHPQVGLLGAIACVHGEQSYSLRVTVTVVFPGTGKRG
jgi:hypothetical protein